MKYLNFELSVDARSDGAFDARSRSPGGDVRAVITLPFSAEELEFNRVSLEHAIELSRGRDIVRQGDEAPSTARLATAEAFGTALFNALLTGPILQAYRTSRAIADSQDMGLRIQLRLQPPGIAALPWEFMFDPADGSFVALNPGTPIVRYPELDLTLKPLAIELPLRILGMAAAPVDLPRLDKAGEVRRIEASVAELQEKGQVELGWVTGGSYEALKSALRHGPWHIFHFIGHGGFDDASPRRGGVLALEGADDRRTNKISAGTLGRLLRGHPSLRLVVLNSCQGARTSDADAFSSVAAMLIRRGIPAAVAMQYQISDQAALAFAQGFYSSLAAGAPVDRAVADARVDVSARREDSLEWGTPVLLMRSPDGNLFSSGGAEPKGQQPGPSVWRRLGKELVLGAVVLPLLVAGALAQWRVRETWVALDARVTGLEVAFLREFSLPDPFPVARLGISGLSAVGLSYPAGGRTLDADAVLLTPLAERSPPGHVTLDIATEVPKGSRMWLALGDQPGGYVIKTDSLDGATIPATGPVQVVVPRQLNQRIDFGPSGTAVLRSRGRLLRLDFTPAGAIRSPFIDQVPVGALSLVRFDQHVSPGATGLQTVSTVRGGTLRIEGAPDRTLMNGELLRVAAVSGTIDRLDLGGDHLRLQLSGNVRGLETGQVSNGQSLMPSVLGWAVATRPWWVAGAFVLYLALLALALRLRSGRSR